MTNAETITHYLNLAETTTGYRKLYCLASAYWHETNCTWGVARKKFGI